jgi:TPR repeat protein
MPAPAASASPKPEPATSLPQDEIASLLKRGRDLIAAGDIASARLMLTLVAEAGNAEACFVLAGTYDPPVLASLRAIGVQGDPAKARAWYARAAELGSPEARDRLQALR